VAMDTLSGQQIGEYAVPPSSLSQLIGSRAFEKAESLERGIFLPYSSPNEPVKRGYLFSRDLSQVEDGFELELP